jgi:hypothetical protein
MATMQTARRLRMGRFLSNSVGWLFCHRFTAI